MDMTGKHIAILLLGGTIASYTDANGNAVVVDISEYVRRIPAFAGLDVRVNSFKQLGGLETTIQDMVEVSEELKRILRQDQPDGIVVVMGTNVMEEAAFAIQVLVQTDTPIVFTGAMRVPDACGADGPGNLAAAVAAAASPACKGLGVLVVFNDEIHSADYVQKLHPLNPGAFGSKFMLGYVAEGVASVRVHPVRRPLHWIQVKTGPKDVLLYTSYLGDSGRLLAQAETLGFDGLVIEGTGGGSVPSWVFDHVERMHEKMPVVIATRTGNGDVMRNTYGYGYGSPKYREEKGYLTTGHIDSRKARILLTLLLMSECTPEQIRESFRIYSRDYIPQLEANT